MRIKVDRLCELAGIPAASYKSSSDNAVLKEGKGHDDAHEGMLDMYNELDQQDEMDDQRVMDEMYGHMSEEEKAEKEDKKEKDNKDEMIDVDETVLVQELRRARRIMKENKRRQNEKKQNLQEMQLRAVIDQEVKNVLKELQLNSGWIYGDKKPTRSKKGYTHQGSFLKGIGFK